MSIYLLLHMEGQFQTVIMCVEDVKPAVQNEICVVLVDNMSVQFSSFVLFVLCRHLKSFASLCGHPICCESGISLFHVMG